MQGSSQLRTMSQSQKLFYSLCPLRSHLENVDKRQKQFVRLPYLGLRIQTTIAGEKWLDRLLGMAPG